MDQTIRYTDSSYLKQRVEQERAAAAATQDSAARRVHLELAQRYAAMMALTAVA